MLKPTVAVLATLLAAPAPQQAPSLREAVREHGDIGLILIACGPVIGWDALAEYGPLAVEGVIAEAHSLLTPDETDIYTEYVMDVIRVLRAPAGEGIADRPRGTTGLSPFVAEVARARPGATKLRVRFRSPHGTVFIEGHKVQKTVNHAMLVEGQHVIVFAYHRPSDPDWMQFRVFEVRDGRVIPLEKDTAIPPFDSVDQFAAALSNPPPARKH